MKNRFIKGLRNPITWILLAMMLFWGYSQLSNSGRSFKEVETQTIIGAITAKQVDSALLLAQDQQIRVELKSGVKISDSSRLQASYLANQETELVKILSENPPPNKWDVKVTRQSLLVSLLFTIIPFLLIAFIFFYLISRAQGGGRAFQFGRSR
ncbi:MAG: cell division protein FtsH, partial [Actinobacteria bacterium]|nr:cell division protein FtsH [Actinomycetota bacterium]